MSKALDQARATVAEQITWIIQHGGDEEGYVSRYGSKNDPDHYGNGGEAIYKADKAYLDQAIQRLNRLESAVLKGKHKTTPKITSLTPPTYRIGSRILWENSFCQQQTGVILRIVSGEVPVLFVKLDDPVGPTTHANIPIPTVR